jgi:hypothetical protein
MADEKYLYFNYLMSCINKDEIKNLICSDLIIYHYSAVLGEVLGEVTEQKHRDAQV